MRKRVVLIGAVLLAIAGAAFAASPTIAGASPPAQGGSLFGTTHDFVGASPSSNAKARSNALPANATVVASGLNQPKKITIGPDGNLIVALSGDGAVPAGCTTGAEAACQDNSGAIDKVTPSGTVSTLLSGLPSVSSPPAPGEATGPAEALYANGDLQVLFQNTNIDPTTGQQTYGAGGALLGTLAKFNAANPAGSVEASFGPFEAAHNPDGGAGTAVTMGLESAIDSDPYSFIPYRGGYAVADAAGNDLLYVSPTGAISVLAVFPTIAETAPPGSLGPSQTTPEAVQAQAVPSAVALGPDGNLYVGELGGAPFVPGTSSIFRVDPGPNLAQTTPVPVASGFTAIGDIAFDQAGRLLVLEIDQAGIGDTASPPTPGAVIRVNANGTQSVLASTGLEFPTGMAVARDGSIYVSNYGVLSATGEPGGVSGEIVRIASSTPADQLGANLGGYRLAASDGGVFTFGSFGFYGSMGGKPLKAPVVGAESLPSGPGYWLVASDGGVFTFGAASFYGSAGGIKLDQPIVGMAATPDGRGYWLVASDGGVFTYGDATYYGSAAPIHLRQAIVSISPTPDGRGYYLVASDGGVFTYGDAKFNGSAGALRLKAPVVSSAITPDGGGYYLVASDGGVFTYGDAKFNGSAGALRLKAPVVGSEITPNGGGYYLVASDGGVFTYGNAVFYGSTGALNLVKPVVAIG